MRIGNPTNNEFFLELNKINDEIQKSFLKKIEHETRSVSCDVMLGDSTTKKVETFDIKNVETFLGKFELHLDEWNSQGVTYSSDEDLRRIFIKSEIKIGNYILSLHISLQYHVLLYYKPIQRVIDLQKKLAELIDAGGNSESKYEEESDRLIIEKLNELGFKDMPKQELFELFYNDEELAKKIKTVLKTNLGILVLSPPRVTTDVTSIGPKNQASGILKYSAIKAPGIDTIITNANSLDKICLKFSLLNGIAWLFCMINENRFFGDWTYYLFSY